MISVCVHANSCLDLSGRLTNQPRDSAILITIFQAWLEIKTKSLIRLLPGLSSYKPVKTNIFGISLTTLLLIHVLLLSTFIRVKKFDTQLFCHSMHTCNQLIFHRCLPWVHPWGCQDKIKCLIVYQLNSHCQLSTLSVIIQHQSCLKTQLDRKWEIKEKKRSMWQIEP